MDEAKKAKVKGTGLLSCLGHNFSYHPFFEENQEIEEI